MWLSTHQLFQNTFSEEINRHENFGVTLRQFNRPCEPSAGNCKSFAIAAGELIDEAPRYLPENIFVEKYINADALLPDCDVIVCHGGNSTIYQALRHGIPIVAIPFHNEQDYNARRMQQLGLGKRLASKQVWRDFTQVLTTMEEVVNHTPYREAAQAFQRHLIQWQGSYRAIDLIESHFDSTSVIPDLPITSV